MLLDPEQARILFQDALQQHYAVLAVNADSPAAITDCLEAARLCGSPIIIETSLWQLTGRSFGAGDAIVGLTNYAAQLAQRANTPPYDDLPILLHTDHIKGPQTVEILTSALRGLPLGLNGEVYPVSPSTLSLDSSELSESENIDIICTLCAAAQESRRPVTLEMEAGVDDGLTPPDVAQRLLSGVEKTYPGTIWLWAPGVGTRHGLSDSGFPEFSAEAVERHRLLAKEITKRDIGIVLHGSSGLSSESLQAAVKAGVVKVNWSSESLKVRSAAAADFYKTHEVQLRPGHAEFKASSMDNGVQSFVSQRYLPVVTDRIELLGGKGMASGAMARIRQG